MKKYTLDQQTHIKNNNISFIFLMGVKKGTQIK